MGETIVCIIVKFHLIFPHDVVSSPYPASQKHLRELLTQARYKHIPAGCPAKMVDSERDWSHRNNALLWSLYALQSQELFLQGRWARSDFWPCLSSCLLSQETTWHVSLYKCIDSTERIIWKEQRWGKNSGHPNKPPTGDLVVINLAVACKLPPCLSGFVTEMRENGNSTRDCTIVFI